MLMNISKIIDKAIMPFAPRVAFKRQQFRMAYEAATPSKRRKPHRAVSRNPNDETGRNAYLMSSARDAEQNHDLASGVLDVLVNNVVGTGVLPEPQIKTMDGKPAKDLNNQIVQIHREWAKRPEVTREYNHQKAQRLAARTWLRDGEVFSQLLNGRSPGLGHQTNINFSYELIEPDYIPMSHTAHDQGIYQGIQRSKWGAPKFYFIQKDNPYTTAGTGELRKIRAANMTHLKLAKRIKQGRGVTVFHNVLIRFADVKEYEDYERIAARVAAALTGYIKRNPEYGQGELSTEEDQERHDFQMAPGLIIDELKPGEEIGVIQSNRPNNALLEFRGGQLKGIAAGTGTGYSSISKSYDGNYSAQRQELVEQFQNYRALQMEFIDGHVMPIYERFLLAVRASDVLGNIDQIDKQTLDDVSFEVPQMPWIDPSKEMNAYQTAHENKFMDRSLIQRRLGINPRHVQEQFELELEDKGTSVSTEQSTEVTGIANAYGVSVRAGAITPQEDDESHFRTMLNLPEASEDVVEAWGEDGGTRRPITLKSGDAFESEQDKIKEEDEIEDEKTDE